ncbi:hypothetical protein DFH08DRAFT_396548 [Mycena albidolilacea]|uniref:Uncharacterized protein n=1 Tax=Mycena albidolilacea TaxID=1033008 RepID=A0AAD7EG48_9AGAR|nr:hypothetical protein DFH08DRAFT_396548 [Mycena albidolilacea]
MRGQAELSCSPSRATQTGSFLSHSRPTDHPSRRAHATTRSVYGMRGRARPSWSPYRATLTRSCLSHSRPYSQGGFGVNKGDMRVGSHGDTRNLRVRFDANKGDLQVGFDVDKDTTHKARRGLGYGAWDGCVSRCCARPVVRGMGTWCAIA